MALLIFPIGVVLGWFVHSPMRAAVATAAVGVVGLVAMLSILGMRDIDVSPLETIVLIVGTPIAARLAFLIARWRQRRRVAAP